MTKTHNIPALLIKNENIVLALTINRVLIHGMVVNRCRTAIVAILPQLLLLLAPIVLHCIGERASNKFYRHKIDADHDKCGDSGCTIYV